MTIIRPPLKSETTFAKRQLAPSETPPAMTISCKSCWNSSALRSRTPTGTPPDSLMAERAKLKENKTPTDTLKRGVGTDKDISLLFGAMAASLGFDVRVVRVGNRRESFFNPSLTIPFFISSYGHRCQGWRGLARHRSQQFLCANGNAALAGRSSAGPADRPERVYFHQNPR